MIVSAQRGTNARSLLCWAMIVPALLVDAASGFLVQGLGIDANTSLLFKGALIVLLAVDLACRQPYAFVILLLPFAGAALARPLAELAGGNAAALSYDVPVALRVLLLPLIFAFAIGQIRENTARFERLATLTLTINFVLVCASILAGPLGFGLPTYASTGLGFKGYFVAGNELSAVLIVSAAFILSTAWRNSSASRYVLASVLSVLAAVLLATKAAILASIIICVAIPVLGNDRMRVAPRVVAAALMVFAGLVLSVYLLREPLISTALGQRLIFVYERVGLVDLVFSGRLEFFERYIASLRDTGGIWDALIGFGSSNLLGSGPTSVELDFVDVAIVSGMPVAATMLVAATALVLASLTRVRSHPYAAGAFLANVLLLFFALTAGHVWTSGMLGIGWMLLHTLGTVAHNADAAGTPATGVA